MGTTKSFTALAAVRRACKGGPKTPDIAPPRNPPHSLASMLSAAAVVRRSFVAVSSGGLHHCVFSSFLLNPHRYSL